MSSLDALYQQVILDHSRKRSGSGSVEGMEHTSYQVNPTCGDEVTLGVVCDGAGTPTSIVWDGDGCSISQASLSMMWEALQDADLETVRELFSAVEQMMHSRGSGMPDEVLDLLGDSAALEGTSKFANRIKCALLGWYALRDAMAQAGVDIVSTGGDAGDSNDNSGCNEIRAAGHD